MVLVMFATLIGDAQQRSACKKYILNLPNRFNAVSYAIINENKIW